MSKIDILIPTYNRAAALMRNLELLACQIVEEKVAGKVQIIVSNNASTDNTEPLLRQAQLNLSVEIKAFSQAENVGLENNAIFLLGKSFSEFVLFLGDDDYIPPGYLEYLIRCINEVDGLGAVVPGNSALYADGALEVVRSGKKPVETYRPSFATSLRMSQYGHQLSGLLLRREGLYERYFSQSEYHNIYPFVAFLAWNCVSGAIIYAPQFQVSITVFNTKDWKYDESGLLSEIFKNYYLVFGRKTVRSLLSCSIFCVQQPSRLRVLNLKAAVLALLSLWRSPEVDFSFKIFLPTIYAFLLLRKMLRIIGRFVTNRYSRRAMRE